MKWTLLIAMITVIITGCRHDPLIEPTQMGTLVLRVVPEWEGQPMEYFTEKRDIGDHRITVELVKFYLSNMGLTSVNGTLDLSDVRIYNLVNGPVEDQWKVPVGAYSAFTAGLGVSSNLNHTDPAAYPTTHPLGINSGTYWSWNSGYRFAMFEGRYDPDPQSTATLISSYSIHTGLDTCYAPFSLSPDTRIEVTAGTITQITLHVAIDRFFYSDSDTLDIATENESHGSNLPVALKLTRNIVSSFTLE